MWHLLCLPLAPGLRPTSTVYDKGQRREEGCLDTTYNKDKVQVRKFTHTLDYPETETHGPHHIKMNKCQVMVAHTF